MASILPDMMFVRISEMVIRVIYYVIFEAFLRAVIKILALITAREK